MTYKMFPSILPNAWIGTVPSDVPHGKEGSTTNMGHKTIDARHQGQFEMEALLKPVRY